MGKWDYLLQDMEMLSLTLWLSVDECECWGNWQAAVTGSAQVQSKLWSSSCTRCSAKGLQPSPTTSLFFHYWDFPKHTEPKGHINTCCMPEGTACLCDQETRSLFNNGWSLCVCFSPELILAPQLVSFRSPNMLCEWAVAGQHVQISLSHNNGKRQL